MKIIFDDDDDADNFFNRFVLPLQRAAGALEVHGGNTANLDAIASVLQHHYFSHYRPPAPPPVDAGEAIDLAASIPLIMAPPRQRRRDKTRDIHTPT